MSATFDGATNPPTCDQRPVQKVGNDRISRTACEKDFATVHVGFSIAGRRNETAVPHGTWGPTHYPKLNSQLWKNTEGRLVLHCADITLGEIKRQLKESVL